MSQQINLFNPIFRKKGFSFTSSTAMLYGVGIAAAVGAMGAGYAQYQLRDASTQAQVIEQEHKDTVARFDKLTAEVAQQKPNTQLEADVAKLDAQLKGRQEVIDTLKSGAVGNTGGFSEYMRAFSRQNVSGLWLTGFDIARGGNELVLQGRSLSGDLVAAYLKQLNQEKSLQGRQFAALRIGQPLADPVTSPKADAAAQGQKDAKDQNSVAPRYLEFTISTVDIPENSKPVAKSMQYLSFVPQAIETSAVLDARKTAAGQETAR